MEATLLDHLGLSPPEQEKPPPAREVVRVPVDDEGRQIQARELTTATHTHLRS